MKPTRAEANRLCKAANDRVVAHGFLPGTQIHNDATRAHLALMRGDYETAVTLATWILKFLTPQEGDKS